ncbi:hypothetical protein BGW38_005993, partial [Lunasporangiospora selenospora]
TTDKLFLYKPHLYDVLVDLSAPDTKGTYPDTSATAVATAKAQPRIKTMVQTNGKERVAEDTLPNMTDHYRYSQLMQRLRLSRQRLEWSQRRSRRNSSNSSGGGIGVSIYDTMPSPTVSLQDRARQSSYGDGMQDIGELNHQESIDSDADDQPLLGTVQGQRSGGFSMSYTLQKMVGGGWWWWYGEGGHLADDEGAELLLQRDPENQHGAGLIGEILPGSGTRMDEFKSSFYDNLNTEAIRFFHDISRTFFSKLEHRLEYKATAAIFDDLDDDQSGRGGSSSSRNKRGVLVMTKRDLWEMGMDPYRDGEFVKEVAHAYFDTEIRLKRFDFWKRVTRAARRQPY